MNELDSGAVTDEKHTLELFRRELIPHVHTHLIARYVSTDYWDQAGTVEQAEFVSALSDYLLSTYSLLLTYGLKTGIEVLPDARVRGSTAVVFAVLKAARKGPLTLQFRLVATTDAWKIFGVTANGVSLIKTLRAQFQAFDSTDGLASLTSNLTDQARRTSPLAEMDRPGLAVTISVEPGRQVPPRRHDRCVEDFRRYRQRREPD